MRVNIAAQGRGKIPINVYAIDLGVSGLGKGYATNIIEESVINQFKKDFLEFTFPLAAEENLAKLATFRAARKVDGDPEAELESVKREFTNLGELLFSFDSATPAAIKQMRQKLLMSKCGSMNLEIDEIGSNLLGNKDSLNVCLELYDVGKVKPKLVKNTAENIRSEEIDGRTPTNLLLFGTPSKLLDGGKVEDEFISFNDTGYARRSIFGYYPTRPKKAKLTPQEELDALTDTTDMTFINKLSDDMGELANIANFAKTLTMSQKETLTLIEYKQLCETRSDAFKTHESIHKAEMSHRHFKALKIAGAYAFIDGADAISEDHLYNAIKLTEESGEHFKRIMTREQGHVKLAKFIAEMDGELTLADLEADLPFYKGSESQKKQMLTLATAWGYTNNIIIKRSFRDGIDFIMGDALKDTDINKLTLSFSPKMAEGYKPTLAPFDKLHKMMCTPGLNWCNHSFIKNHRAKQNVILGFNMLVLDVDGGTSLATAELLLQQYSYFMYTTKRSTPAENRFRIVIPMSHVLKLTNDEYQGFVDNVLEWLPFEADDCSNQASKKWATHKGQHVYNTGVLFDCLPFIPKTSKNKEMKAVIDSQQALDRVERWFINNTEANNNRNKQLLKYALMLVDSGLDESSISAKVLSLNSKFKDSLPETEIMTSILFTAAKKIALRDA